MDLSYRKVYEWGAARLEKSGVSEAKLDARLLLEYVCNTERHTLLVDGDREVTSGQYESYVNYIGQREKHVPLQYITGVQEFMGLEFEVNENVLIPRQDTEILVEEVMRYLHDGMRILDMCTGSGCILLSLLYYSNDCSGVGVDVSGPALDIAMRNAARLSHQKGMSAAADGLRADFLQSDLFDRLEQEAGKFELIVSNPPYIKSGEIGTLMPEVRDYEPRMALDGSADGLCFYRKIIDGAGKYLSGGGQLFFEIGDKQGEAVKNMMETAGYKRVEIVKDYSGLDRVVHGSLVK